MLKNANRHHAQCCKEDDPVEQDLVKNSLKIFEEKEFIWETQLIRWRARKRRDASFSGALAPRAEPQESAQLASASECEQLANPGKGCCITLDLKTKRAHMRKAVIPAQPTQTRTPDA